MAYLIGVSGSIEQEDEKVFLMRCYFQALEAAGLTPVLLSLDTRGQNLTDCLTRLDGLMLAGGWDFEPQCYGQEQLADHCVFTPLRDTFEMELIREAVRLRLPTLGICRGVQAMNVALGGTLYQDIPSQKPDSLCHNRDQGEPATHEVAILPDTPLFRAVHSMSIRVNSYHHQAILRLADALKPCAVSPDGIVEGAYQPDLPYFMGVQWHPEKVFAKDEASMAIFRDFAAACQANI